MKDKIANLIDLKSLVTMALVIGTVVGFFMHMIDAETYTRFVELVLVFYFAKTSMSAVKEEKKDIQGIPMGSGQGD